MAVFNGTSYTVDRVRRVTEINPQTKEPIWTAAPIANPNWEFTGETRDKTDANGVLMASFDSAKGVSFSGEADTWNIRMLASQRGGKVQVASETAPLSGETFEIVKVVTGADGAKTATLAHTPKAAPAFVYPLTKDKNINTEEKIAVGVETGSATLSGEVITLPANFEGTQVGVLYEYETTSAVKFVDSSEEFSDSRMYIIDVLYADPCNSGVKRAASIVFPMAKIDNNLSINLTTEGTHPFSFRAMKEYCEDEAQLCYVIVNE